MIYVILFLVGASLGSFINVLSFRYKEDKFILDKKIIGGRSHCNYCGKKLNWYELIPIISFIIQRGRCRQCHNKLSWQYLLVELVCGLIFILTLIYFKNNLITFFPKTLLAPIYFGLTILIWDLIFLTLVLISLIDLKLKIIPNETIIFLFILSIFLNFLTLPNWNNFYSFLGAYNLFFGSLPIWWQNKLIAFIFSLLFFGGLVFLTWGKGMGLGDVKLMMVLSLIFGWPETLIITVLSFIIGGVAGLVLLITKKKRLKSSLPFGPFIVLAVFLVFFYGELILKLYLKIGEKLIIS